jgi:hypothetical protein
LAQKNIFPQKILVDTHNMLCYYLWMLESYIAIMVYKIMPWKYS